MAKKLAMTVAGAVSLGSYESGVMFEILDAVGQHNLAVGSNDEKRIEIDVITGASAGAMTATVVAHKLLTDGASMTQPYNNPMYNSWVTGVSIEKLVKLSKTDDPAYSIFSSSLIESIAKAALDFSKPVGAAHSAAPKDGTLGFGLALSNLNGLDYWRSTKVAGQRDILYTRHTDRLAKTLSRDISSPEWQAVRDACVASGAFPFAFRVKDLLRQLADFPSALLDKSPWGDNDETFFAYTDGGVFDNQPIGMAKSLVERRPDGRLTALERGYLFIAPQSMLSRRLNYTTDTKASYKDGFGSANANFWNLAPRLINAIFNQARYRDWVEAEKVNDQLTDLDAWAALLHNAFIQDSSMTNSAPAVAVILSQFFPGPALADARTQLKSQYGVLYAQFGNTATADVWLDTVLVLETSAGLHFKEEMSIYDFVAEPGKLAGGGMMSFGGFFDLKYRVHDYDYGRSVARARLNQYKDQAGSVFEGLQWDHPQDINPIDHGLDNLDLSKIDRSKRQLLLQCVLKSLGKALDLGGVKYLPNWFAKVVASHVIKPLLKL